MPDLGKQKSSIPMLADTEDNNGENPCETLSTQAENQSATPDDISQWWSKAKQSSWLPWAVAAGFGVLWLRKGKSNQ